MSQNDRSSLFSVLAALALPLGTVAQEIRLGGEFQVNAYTVSAQRYPRVAAEAGGDFVVVWQSYGQDGSKWGVFARRFTSAGAPLISEFQVNSLTGDDQYHPSVAADADGDFVVAWQSFDGSGYGIFARRFASTGDALATEFQVNTLSSGDQRVPSVAADADGDFVVAWDGFGDGSVYGIRARRFSSAGTALAAELQVNTYVTGNQRYSAIAAAASGDFVVAWQSYEQDGLSNGIFARRFTGAGTAHASEFQVNTRTEGGQFFPSVAADADGDFVVAWQSEAQDGSSNGISARRFTSAGGDLGPEFQVNTFTPGEQRVASVAASADGDFVVTWQSESQDGANYGIFARRFTSAGAALATEFQVNTHTSDSQSEGSAAMGAGGALVVAWRGEVLDGSEDVFAQRFARLITLDVDGDGSLTALTDGLLVLRYAFGFRGATLINGAVNLAGCTRCDAAAIESYLAGLS